MKNIKGPYRQNKEGMENKMNRKAWLALLAFVPGVLFAACGQAGGSASSKTASSAVSTSSAVSSAVSSAASSSSSASASSVIASTYYSGTQVANLCGAAQGAYMSDEYDKAMSLADQAIAVDPNCFQAYNIKGAAYYFANGNSVSSAALDLINKSLTINPNYDYGYFNKALIYKGLKEYDQSIAAFQKNIDITPTAAWAYYGIATIYADTSQNDQALTYLQKAIALDSSIKQTAKQQSHWDNLRNNATFQSLVD